jgi:hypothetical protein
MSESDVPKKGLEHLSGLQLEKAEKSIAQQRLARKVKELSGDSEWTILEQILQEIEATYMIKKEKVPGNDKLHQQLIDEVTIRYEEEPELKQTLLEGIPSRVSISKWRNKKGWPEALWTKVRLTGLFTGPKRAMIINSLYDQAADGNVNAAKVWLTLSGDYSEKPEVTSAAEDKYREINQIIHGNKNK